MKISTIIFAFLLFIPFVFTNQIFDGKIWAPYYYTISLGSVLALTVSYFLLFRERKLKISITAIDCSIFLLTAYVGLQLLFMPYPKASTPYFYIIVLFFLIAKTFKPLFEGHQWQLLILITTFLLIGILEGGYGILQQTEMAINHVSHFTVSGTFNNPGPYSNYLVVVFIFAFGFFLHFKPIDRLQSLLRYFALASAIIIALILPYTKARTSWLAAIVGLIMIIWPMFKLTALFRVMFGNLKKKAISFSILTTIILTACIFLYQYKPQSAKGRILIYEVSLYMIKDKPVFGHGFCRFLAEYNNYQADYFKEYPLSDNIMLADNVKTGFNEFIQITIELGITGLLLFIGFIVLLFRSKPKPEWSYIAYPAKGALLAVLICCLFSYPLRILPIAVNIVFLLAIVIASNANRGYNIRISKWIYKPIAFIAPIAVLFVGYLQWKDFEARKQWKHAIDYTQVQDYKRALPYYQDAYKILNYDGFFLYNYGSELLEIDAIKSVKILEEATRYLGDNDLYVYLGDGYKKLKDYAKAEEFYLLSSYMVPCKFFPRYKLFRLYEETGRISKASNTAVEIANMPVKTPSVAVSAIKSEVDQWLLNQK